MARDRCRYLLVRIDEASEKHQRQSVAVRAPTASVFSMRRVPDAASSAALLGAIDGRSVVATCCSLRK
jgi:hypothetical protein